MADDQAATPNDFFVAGGTLRATAPSYVLRPADEELFTMAAQGAFCYVLTPRQMGKSSLMIRTSRRLSEQGIRTGIVDLTQIGAKVSIEQWYLGLLSQLRRSLKLITDYAEWWNAHSALGEVQRFSEFLREVLLTEIGGRVVIFIDEIDSTLQLNFRDDFFAAIRAMYNARAESPDFQRLSFVLLGVASPPDLIKDMTRTPFNIGQAIALKEFSRADAAVLQDELEKQFEGKGGDILDRVYYWTNGHPYLTQKLCLTIAERAHTDWNNDAVDQLVRQQLLTEEARKESNLQYVQNNILWHPLKVPMLKLYRRVVHGESVTEDQSREQNQLKLSGLLKANIGKLQIHNRVYEQVFNMDWVGTNIPVNWAKHLLVAAIGMLVVLLGLFVYFFIESNYLIPNRVRSATADFFQKTDSKDRIAAMVTIIRSKGTFDNSNNTGNAMELFYTLALDDQLRLFDLDEIQEVSDEDIVTVIKSFYVTLIPSEVDGMVTNYRLLEAMHRSLESRESNDASKLRKEIDAWLAGAAAEAKGDTTLAERMYSSAISLNANNPAIWFARAKLLSKTNRPAEALRDFNQVVSIARQIALTTRSVEPTKLVAESTQTKFNTPDEISQSITPTALSTPNLTVPASEVLPTPTLSRFISRFITSGQMIGAVRDYIASNIMLVNTLALSSVTSTLELRKILPVTLLTPIPTRTVIEATRVPLPILTKAPTSTLSPVTGPRPGAMAAE